MNMSFLRYRFILPFVLVFAGFLVFVFVAYTQYGVSWDESFYWYSGKLMAVRFFDTKFITNEIPKKHLLTHGMFFDGVYYILQKHNGLELDIERLHLVKALFSALTLLPLYLTLYTLTKSSRIASMGMLLLIFYPRWVGDIFDNHMDSISTYLYAWAGIP